MAQPVVIVGGGGFGREVSAWALDAGSDVVGFLDDATGVDDSLMAAPHLGGIDVAVVPAGASAVIAIGDPVARFEVAKRLARRGVGLATVVHPTAYVARSASLGTGVVVCPFAMVSTHAHVGDNVAINTYASVAHDAQVGAHAVFSPYATVNGHTEIGDGTFLGTGAVVTPGIRVGSWCKVTAGAVASRAIPDGTLAVGSPAKGRVMFVSPA